VIDIYPDGRRRQFQAPGQFHARQAILRAHPPQQVGLLVGNGLVLDLEPPRLGPHGSSAWFGFDWHKSDLSSKGIFPFQRMSIVQCFPGAIKTAGRRGCLREKAAEGSRFRRRTVMAGALNNIRDFLGIA
jgi:hypothetical protein